MNAGCAALPRCLLVPVDMGGESERAIAHAVSLAQALDASICLFSWSFDSGEAQLARTYFEEVAAGLPVTAAVRVAATSDMSAAPSILAAAAALDATIVMATHARSGIGQAFLGSVGEDVLRAIDRPLVLVGPHADDRPSTGAALVACLDASEVARRLLPVAEQWAMALGLPVHLVHVIPTGASPAAESGPPDLVESGYLERLARHVHGAGETQFEVLHGDPARSIADYSHRAAALIAVATHARDGFDRVLGSVAMEIVHRSHSPVLVVRPELVKETHHG